MEVKEIDMVKNSSFAVVQLRPGTETTLLRVLLENGYTNVSFTNAKGEMVKLMGDGDDHQPHARNDRDEHSLHSDGHGGDGDDDEEDDDRRVESEELLEADDDQDVDVEVDDSDLDSIEAIKEENRVDMIKEKVEKELLESFYPKKLSIIDSRSSSESIDDDGKLLEQIKDQGAEEESINKGDVSPLEFSSLTLPTVLWGANAAASSSGNSAVDQSQPKLPPSFPYNPFLSAAVNPFLSYLPPTSGDPSGALQALKVTQDLPYPFPAGATTTEAIAAALWSRHAAAAAAAAAGAANHPSQLLDTPPATPRGSNESHCLITGAKLRQRGRQLRRHERDSSAYASCRLCRNRILANRLSNLHNHVRRHAVLKQFHCCYCSYAHTEVAKVRLHMLHNHKDDRSQPLDKRNDDMESAWAMLMRECFPGYA